MDKLIRYLQYNNKESPIYVPNEIFVDLIKGIDKRKHVPFAYAYYYLSIWLYRFTKHSDIGIDNKGMKEVLGYSPTYTPINYLIKKNGVLDEMGYTSTVKDYPISWEINDDRLDFCMLNDLEEEFQETLRKTKSRKYTIKFPVKAFYRYEDSEDKDGMFYNVSNTHLVPFDVFLFCMNKKDIGCTGFYIWCYLKMKNQIFTEGYDVNIGGLVNELNIPRRTLINYLNTLREYGMVSCHYNQEFFCLALKDDDKQSNTYVTNDYESFNGYRIEFERLKVVKVKEYQRMEKMKKRIE